MSWARLDDRAWQNEKLLALSPSARLLWYAGLSYVAGGWPGNGGAIAQASARVLVRLQGVSTQAIAELVKAGRWETVGESWRIHDVSDYLPPADLSEKRRMAGRVGGRVSRSKPEANARASAQAHAKQATRARAPASRPVPLTTTPSPNGSLVVRDDDPFADLLAPTKVDLVGAYVDACRAAGAEPVAKMPARVGAAVKTLRDAGKTDEVLVIAVRELARRNEQPARLAWIVGDVERVQAGTPIGRVRPPALTVNPVDARVAAKREHIAELRAQEARDAQQR